jgi:hypothetical protein
MLAAKYGDKLEKNITEYPKAMILGDTPYVRYVKNFRKKDDPIAYQAQVLTTCKSGRMYNFELQVFQDKVKEHRDLGYAVAAGVQFKGGAKAAAPATTEEKPSDPAEESNPGESK